MLRIQQSDAADSLQAVDMRDLHRASKKLALAWVMHQPHPGLLVSQDTNPLG